MSGRGSSGTLLDCHEAVIDRLGLQALFPDSDRRLSRPANVIRKQMLFHSKSSVSVRSSPHGRTDGLLSTEAFMAQRMKGRFIPPNRAFAAGLLFHKL